MRPTLIFTPGRFVDDIRGYLILLDRVDHKTSEVGGVRINDIRNPQNPVMILAERGLMEFIDGGNTIKFTLYDGEINELNMKDPSAYKRISFGKQIFYVTGVGSELVRSESGHKTDREMNIAEMEDYISKVKMSMNPFRQRATTLVSTEFESLFDDSVATSYAKDTTYLNMNDSMALVAFRDRVSSVERRVERTISQIKEQEKLVARYQIEINKKYSIPFAGVVFVLFGAPLAIMTRRGGMGFSIAVSLGIFVLYWASLIAGEDLADRGLIDPYSAMWGANVFVGIIGLFLIYLMYTERPITALLRKRSETTL
ncbi:MAG: LptF/LptG family permease, partial [candidate division Zixibacteria bacterium]|nr:LptF/LptG family permease [candidate division Zixibacteria bacterium]